jgi:hypothetical protein
MNLATASHADCPKCDPCNPELDEDGRPYTCYFCCDTGRVDTASAAAYWQDLTDSTEYVQLRPVVNGKHIAHRCDEYDSWTVELPLLPRAVFPKAPAFAYSDGSDDIAF